MTNEEKTDNSNSEELVFERGEGDSLVTYKVRVSKTLNAKKFLHLKNYISGKIVMKTVQDGRKKNGQIKWKTIQETSGGAAAELETETMKAYIVSFNDKTADAYNRMMEELNGTEYEAVWDLVESLDEKEEKK